MSITILKGTIVSAPALGKLEVMEHGYLVAEDSRIAGVFPVLPEYYAGAPVEDYGDALILQSLADLHLHAPQYPMLGMGMDLPLLDCGESGSTLRFLIPIALALRGGGIFTGANIETKYGVETE